MRLSRSAAGILCIGAMAADAGVTFSQEYPGKPVRIITADAGGTGDVVARQIAQGLSGNLGQQVIVDNRGGGAIISGQLVAKAPPDGYTLLVFGGSFWIAPLMRDRNPYDAVRDFAPISLVASTPIVLSVHASLPAKSVRDLIQLARTRPGELDYVSGPAGAVAHLAGELFKTLAGVRIMHIPYKGEGPALVALAGGQVHLSFLTAGAVTPMMQSGKLRALAVTSAQPSALLPTLPTVAASGLPGYETSITYGMFAPARTPNAIIARLHQETTRLLSGADAREKLLSAGIEYAGSSPAEFAATIKSDITKMSKVIKDAGIRID